jgi:hypothetical protein
MRLKTIGVHRERAVWPEKATVPQGHDLGPDFWQSTGAPSHDGSFVMDGESSGDPVAGRTRVTSTADPGKEWA